MRKWLERVGYISVRTYLIIVLCIIFPLFLAFGFIRGQYEQYIQDQLSEQIISSISKSEEAVHTSFRNMAGISSAIVTNYALLDVLSSPEKSYYEINKLFDECVNYTRINNLYTSDDLLLTLFDREQRCYANWSLNFHDYRFLLENDWIKQAFAEKGHLVWNLFTPAFVLGQDQGYISVARAIPDSSSGENALGLLIVSMPQDNLSRVLASFCFAPEDSVYVLGDENKPILEYAPGNAVLPEELEAAVQTLSSKTKGNMRLQTADGMKLVSYYTLDAPWTLGEQALRIVHFTDFQSVLGRMDEFSQRMTLIGLLSLTLALLIAAVIVRMLVQPVRQLSHVMGHYHLGEPLDGLNMERRDEMGHLNRSFRQLTDNIQELFADLDNEYKVKEKYRYESLRSQLNPHFLFNTLNTIRYMSMMQHADSITAGIDALAATLKYSMGREGEMSSLQDEIDHVKSYIAIENMRFGCQVEVEEDFEPATLTLLTPRFILQPIVENAVIHGFGQNVAMGRRCLIRLYGHLEDGTLHLFVEDNGDGVAPETLNALNNGARSRDKMTGIGFSHVKELIEISFGSGYTVQIESMPEIGTIVHYRLPMLEAKEEENHEHETSSGRG